MRDQEKDNTRVVGELVNGIVSEIDSSQDGDASAAATKKRFELMIKSGSAEQRAFRAPVY